MLIIFGGLPGVGKSTVAKALATRIGACYLRVDTVEQAIRDSAILAHGQSVGAAGYLALYRLAADNLRLGNTILADTVNSISITRNAFREVAAETQRRCLEVEIVCSDSETHRRRAETRLSTSEGQHSPTWAEIQGRSFEPWQADLRLDTSVMPIEECVAEIVKRI